MINKAYLLLIALFAFNFSYASTETSGGGIGTSCQMIMETYSGSFDSGFHGGEELTYEEEVEIEDYLIELEDYMLQIPDDDCMGFDEDYGHIGEQQEFPVEDVLEEEY